MQVTFQNVQLGFGEKQIFSDFSHTFSFAGATALMGASGVGKTTFLRVLCGLEKPDSGAVLGFPSRYTFLFQEDRLLPWLDALHNVSMVCTQQEAVDWLAKVGLSEELHAMPAELSGGMRQRVAFARALAHKSDFLLLDEPFKGLDEACRAEMLALLQTELDRRPVLFVTHDPAEAEMLQAQTLHLKGMPVEL